MREGLGAGQFETEPSRDWLTAHSLPGSIRLDLGLPTGPAALILQRMQVAFPLRNVCKAMLRMLLRLAPLPLLTATAAFSADTGKTAIYLGQRVSYELVDGMAVHDGDILLGTEKAVAAASPATGKLGFEPAPRLAAPRSGESYKWPQAQVPYVIAADFSAAARATIRSAIEHWNSKTVVNLVPRTTETDFVRFTAATGCSSFVGRKGGEQQIRLLAQGGCSLSITIHEIGHAVGLLHEHQRVDRDERVMIRQESVIPPLWRLILRLNSREGTRDHFDYASVMNYARPYMDSIPPGMHFRGDGGLSPGDIDAIARMYGQPPTATTVSTNPPGLEVLVDGIATTTPATFNWLPGSSHTLEVAATPQLSGNNRYLFGRWNDGGPQVRTVTAGSRTWFEANFIVQRRVVSQVLPAIAGSVSVEPESPDGWYTIRSTVSGTAIPTPASGFEFLRWGDQLSSNPRTEIVPPHLHAASNTRPPSPVRLAQFSRDEPFLVESTAGRFRLKIGEVSRQGPVALLPSDRPGTVTVTVPKLAAVPGSPNSRHRFEGWSDGGSSERTIAIASQAGATLTAQVSVEHRLAAITVGEGRVAFDPPSDDSFYAAGSVVRATAQPDEGWEFVAWTGDVALPDMREVSVELTMERPHRIGAVFSQTPRLVADSDGTTVVLPGSTGALGYRVDPDPAATTLTISFSATSTTNVDLYVKAVTVGEPERSWRQLFVNRGTSQWDPAADADFSSEASGGSEQIEITASSVPPLDPSASYYVTLATATQPQQPIEGLLRLKTEGEGGAAPPAGRVSPRALTLVSALGSSPAAQAVRVTNEGGSDMSFRANSTGGPWLLVTPATGLIAPGASADLQISASPLGLEAGTHDGIVSIERNATTGVHFESIGISVTYVAY